MVLTAARILWKW